MRKFSLALLVTVTAIGMASVALAQPGRGPGGFGFDSSLLLLMNQDVVKELEIVPEQQEKLRALGEEARNEMRDMFSGLRDLNEEERRERFAELREKMADVQADLKKDVNEILLPQQRDRLEQIQFQSQMRRGSGGLTSNSAVEALDISEEQLEKMREKQEEVREEGQEKIQEETEEDRNEILSVLSPAQRKKYEELMGEPFEFQQRQGFGGNRFQGRGQGGRGGDRNRPNRPST